MKEIEMIITLLAGVASSIKRYEKARREQGRKQPFAGHGNLDICDSKESIQRRITVIREELLKLSKSL